jgi:hypothetical protein
MIKELAAKNNFEKMADKRSSNSYNIKIYTQMYM